MKAPRTKKADILPGQLDLFAAPTDKISAPASPAPSAKESPAPLMPANASASAPNTKRASRRGRPLKIEAPAVAEEASEAAWSPSDEWWTSKMVCAFLKISRKTLWERRRMRDLDFPKPTQLGGARNLYRASSVRDWAERIADVEY